MPEAFERWSHYSKEIACDLRHFYPGTHIKQWHQGEMSSRELLELLDGLPDEGANDPSWFKIAVRADYKRMKDEEAAKPMVEGRVKALKGLYRKVPKHLRPKEVV